MFLSSIGLASIPGARSFYKTLETSLRPTSPVYLKNIGMYMDLSIDDGSMGLDLLLKEEIEPYTCKLIEDNIDLGMTCVDIGANIGYMTLLMANKLRGTGHVYSFEPDPYTYEQLKHNVEINNLRNVELSKCAVSDRMGQQTFYINPDARYLNSLYDTASSKIDVTTVTLDDYFKDRVDVIKIDTQGADELVLKGAEKTVKRWHPKIFLEYWPEGLKMTGANPLEILDLLRGHGYKITVVDDFKNQLIPGMSNEEILGLALTIYGIDPKYQSVNLFCEV